MKVIFILIFIFGFFEGSLYLKDYLLVMVAFVIPALAWKD
jgi:hypothetical protein